MREIFLCEEIIDYLIEVKYEKDLNLILSIICVYQSCNHKNKSVTMNYNLIRNIYKHNKEHKNLKEKHSIIFDNISFIRGKIELTLSNMMFYWIDSTDGIKVNVDEVIKAEGLYSKRLLLEIYKHSEQKEICLSKGYFMNLMDLPVDSNKSYFKRNRAKTIKRLSQVMENLDFVFDLETVKIRLKNKMREKKEVEPMEEIKLMPYDREKMKELEQSKPRLTKSELEEIVDKYAPIYGKMLSNDIHSYIEVDGNIIKSNGYFMIVNGQMAIHRVV